MLSNSSTDFIREQYAAYNITIVQANRVVNSDATRRGQVDEVVVRNYGETLLEAGEKVTGRRT